MNIVGLAVVTYKDNFGSALQTYATQRVVNDLGYQTKIFDITGLDKGIRNRKIMYYLTRIIHKDERDYILAMFHSYEKKRNLNNNYAKNMNIRHEMYAQFYTKYISFFPKVNSWKALSQQAEACDAVIVGSDQLWGSANIAGGFFTLEFVPNQVKKIAYSTSFGVSTLPKQLRNHAKKFLKRIDNISVREDTGRKLVKELINQNVPVVCDPTMLLTAEEWMDIQDKKRFIKGEYILTYFMGDNPKQREFAKRLKRETGYRIVGLLHGSTYIESDENYCDETPYNVGPGEFLNLIRNAKYVCTDSFHCSVFSIIYGTEFFAFPRDKEESEFSANDRLHTLLGWTGLSDRFITGDEDIQLQIKKQLDYVRLRNTVEIKRKESMNYLINALMRN